MSIGKQQKLWKNSYQVPATIIHSHHYFWMCSHLYEMSVSELERKSHFILNDELAVDIPVSSVNCYTTKEKAVLARLTEKNPSMGGMVICFGSVCCLLFVRSHVYLGQSILHHFSVCLSLSLFIPISCWERTRAQIYWQKNLQRSSIIWHFYYFYQFSSNLWAWLFLSRFLHWRFGQHNSISCTTDSLLLRYTFFMLYQHACFDGFWFHFRLQMQYLPPSLYSMCLLTTCMFCWIFSLVFFFFGY